MEDADDVEEDDVDEEEVGQARLAAAGEGVWDSSRKACCSLAVSRARVSAARCACISREVRRPLVTYGVRRGAGAEPGRLATTASGSTPRICRRDHSMKSVMCAAPGRPAQDPGP